jgi:hypothetical protein
VCILEDTCTGVTCCISVDFLHKTFSAFVKLDACNHSLKFGIEKIQEEINLFDYSFGKFCCVYIYIYVLKQIKRESGKASNVRVWSHSINKSRENLVRQAMLEFGHIL